MPAKKRHARPGQTPPSADSNRTIQLIGLGAVIVVIALIVWSVLSNRQAETPQALQTAPASQVGNEPAAENTPAGQPKQWTEPPAMTIDPAKKYFATVKMENGGEFTIQLLPDKAPKTVNSFVFLARQGFFDGVTFHRVLEGFMAQGGDPTGTGMGGPGYQFENEDSDLTFDKAGVVAMANAGRDTNGSQFFITYGPQEYLNGGYTIFGQVTEGMDVVEGLRLRDPEKNPNYPGDAIQSVTITEQE